jgi:transcriptional repressor of cell division inhibition gene dicB
MLKSDVIKHFGGQGATARALGITKGAVSQWPDIVPRGSAYQVEVITAGKLRVDPAIYVAKKNPDLNSAEVA